jgi:6-phosphofructokinase 1
MVAIKKTKGVIGILTGGGDVPGLNPAIRAVTIRALREGYQVIGLRRGWLGIASIVRDHEANNNDWYQILTEDIVNKAGRTGGTFCIPRARGPVRWPKPMCRRICRIPIMPRKTI